MGLSNDFQPSSSAQAGDPVATSVSFIRPTVFHYDVWGLLDAPRARGMTPNFW